MILKSFITLLIFLIPTNLFHKFFIPTSYINGLLVDYLIPKFYLSDIIILFLFALELHKHKPFFKNKIIPAIFVFALFIRQFFTTHPISSIWYFFKVTEVGILFFLLRKHSKLLTSKLTYLALSIMVISQSLLAMYQFIFQKSLAGFLLLGEPTLPNSLGLARVTIGGVEKILPYGTTPHPNVLGGVLALSILMLIAIKKSGKYTILHSATLTLGFCAMLLTFSISAWCSLAIGLLIFTTQLFKKKQPTKKLAMIIVTASFILSPILINFLATEYPSNQSLTRRASLNQAAIKMTVDNPLIGVGLNSFTTNLEKYQSSKETLRFLQPTHHVGLLLLAETGLLGLVLIIFSLWESKVLKSKTTIIKLLPLIPIISLDHYLVTTQTGLLLLVFWFAQDFSKENYSGKEMG